MNIPETSWPSESQLTVQWQEWSAGEVRPAQLPPPPLYRSDLHHARTDLRTQSRRVWDRAEHVGRYNAGEWGVFPFFSLCDHISGDKSEETTRFLLMLNLFLIFPSTHLFYIVIKMSKQSIIPAEQKIKAASENDGI